MSLISAGLDYSSASSDSSSESSYTQSTPVAMDLPPEYQLMIDQFLDAYFQPGEAQFYQQSQEYADAIGEKWEELADSYKDRSPWVSKQESFKDWVDDWAADVHNLRKDYLEQVDPDAVPAYLTQYETAAQGVLDAAGKIPEYMSEWASLVPDAYQSAADQYGDTIDNIIDQAMSGASFQEDLPEGTIDKMLAGINISIGGGDPISFAPAGAADAVASLYNTRAGERTKTMGLLADLAQSKSDASIIPAEQQYQYGLLPLTTALDYAEQYPSNLGWFEAMDALRDLWEPMFYTTTTLGGAVPIIDYSSESDADADAFDIGIGAGIG